MKIFKLEVKSVNSNSGPMLGYMSSPSTSSYRYFISFKSAENAKKIVDNAGAVLGIHSNVFTTISEVEVEE